MNMYKSGVCCYILDRNDIGIVRLLYLVSGALYTAKAATSVSLATYSRSASSQLSVCRRVLSSTAWNLFKIGVKEVGFSVLPSGYGKSQVSA